MGYLLNKIVAKTWVYTPFPPDMLFILETKTRIQAQQEQFVNTVNIPYTFYTGCSTHGSQLLLYSPLASSHGYPYLTL
jgi:hypothetical protein